MMKSKYNFSIPYYNYLCILIVIHFGGLYIALYEIKASSGKWSHPACLTIVCGVMLQCSGEGKCFSFVRAKRGRRKIHFLSPGK